MYGRCLKDKNFHKHKILLHLAPSCLLPQVLSNLMPTWLQCMGHIGVHSKSTKPINIGDILYTGTKPDNSCHKAVIVGYRMVEL